MKKSTWLYLVAILFFFFSFYLLTIPGNDLPQVGFFDKIPLFDKWVHIGMFGILTFLFTLASKSPVQHKKSLRIWIALGALVYGIAMEYVQKYCVANRSFDVTDILADGTGCLLAYLFTGWLWRNK